MSRPWIYPEEILIGIPVVELQKWAEDLVKVESSIAGEIAAKITEYLNLKPPKS